MNVITLTQKNIKDEHICCAISSKSTYEGAKAKKKWLECRIREGLRFKKLDVRGKVFIEYLPAENAWVPVDANGYMFINCFWVAGSFKGKGYGKRLLEECENDAKASGYKGIVVTVGNKKKAYLSDKKYLQSHGYSVCDICPPCFELMVKQFDPKAPLPRFKNCAKLGLGSKIKGIDIFYTPQCPFTVSYTKLLEPVIMKSDYPVRITEIKTKEEAQNHICPITTYSVFINGEFYSHEIFTPDKLKKKLDELTRL